MIVTVGWDGFISILFSNENYDINVQKTCEGPGNEYYFVFLDIRGERTVFGRLIYERKEKKGIVYCCFWGWEYQNKFHADGLTK